MRVRVKLTMLGSILMMFFSAILSAAPAPQKDDTTRQLKEAADLYFSYEPQESLKKYLQISKDTHHKDAFLNAAFIAMESFFITRGVKLFCKSVEVRLLT